MRHILTILAFFTITAEAQGIRGLPSLPKSGGKGMGIQGSVGVGFTDFKTLSPSADFQLDRGTYLATSIERGFNVLNLYLTLGLSYMDAEGLANYDYSNLSSSTSYSIDDVSFRARMYELSLGFKLKLIDDYWFRPYIEGGGIGSYNEVSYGGRISELSATGSDYKRKDVIMGSGYYGEGGIEVQFAERFGVKLVARQSVVQTKKLETLEKRPVRLQNETYYFALLFGF